MSARGVPEEGRRPPGVSLVVSTGGGRPSCTPPCARGELPASASAPAPAWASPTATCEPCGRPRGPSSAWRPPSAFASMADTPNGIALNDGRRLPLLLPCLRAQGVVRGAWCVARGAWRVCMRTSAAEPSQRVRVGVGVRVRVHGARPRLRACLLSWPLGVRSRSSATPPSRSREAELCMLLCMLDCVLPLCRAVPLASAPLASSATARSRPVPPPAAASVPPTAVPSSLAASSRETQVSAICSSREVRLEG